MATNYRPIAQKIHDEKRTDSFAKITQLLFKRDRKAAPYFLPQPERPLTTSERDVVERLLRDTPLEFQKQSSGLRVVGRCGCGKCPTIFFQPHTADLKECDLASMQGIDDFNGLVGAVLLHDNGKLTQLEFFSIDGHDPYLTPKPGTLTSM